MCGKKAEPTYFREPRTLSGLCRAVRGRGDCSERSAPAGASPSPAARRAGDRGEVARGEGRYSPRPAGSSPPAVDASRGQQPARRPATLHDPRPPPPTAAAARAGRSTRSSRSSCARWRGGGSRRAGPFALRARGCAACGETRAAVGRNQVEGDPRFRARGGRGGGDHRGRRCMTWLGPGDSARAFPGPPSRREPWSRSGSFRTRQTEDLATSRPGGSSSGDAQGLGPPPPGPSLCP
ncbi:putative uncharacterized protein FRMD6-AS1 [Heterocephalus glaber]|uniref:Uncharacterized protein n=1 Tax=Heterocephalus glaber TaxID=10181 RepID=A0AAX6SPS3_HETGA|nr:putative uncharacterized protein FRMD6-AS1 [Heterocephalus glaber]